MKGRVLLLAGVCLLLALCALGPAGCAGGGTLHGQAQARVLEVSF